MVVVVVTWASGGVERDGAVFGQAVGLGHVDTGGARAAAVELRGDEVAQARRIVLIQAAQPAAAIGRWGVYLPGHVCVAWHQRVKGRRAVRCGRIRTSRAAHAHHRNNHRHHHRSEQGSSSPRHCFDSKPPQHHFHKTAPTKNFRRNL